MERLGGGVLIGRRPGREQLARLRSIDANNDRAVDLREFRAIGERQFANLVKKQSPALRVHEKALAAAFGARERALEMTE